MKTTSVSIENLCVPCHCGCRHCLLSSQHCSTGVDYARSKAFADKFYSWLRKERPELGGLFYVGYCNEFSQLGEHIAFVRKHAPWYDFLQFNGLKMRSEEEIGLLLQQIKSWGIRLIDLSFYGLREYHDRFAGRKGDFAYLLRILHKANETGLPVSVSVALTEENADQMESLFELLSQYLIKSYSVFLPHDKGRGAAMAHLRLTRQTYDRLPGIVKHNFMRVPHRTEAEWLALGLLPEAESRSLTLALMPDNIDRLEAMEPAEIIRELEEMDDAYYAAIPSVAQLANTYGRKDNQQLFRYRDLVLQWQKRYLSEHPVNVHDMNEERHSFSIRTYPNI